MRTLYVLPEHLDTMEMREAMEWATDRVLELDEENQRLRARLEEHGIDPDGEAVQARIQAEGRDSNRSNGTSSPVGGGDFYDWNEYVPSQS